MSITDTTVRDHLANDPVPEQHGSRSRRAGVLVGVPVALLGAVAATFALTTTGPDRPADPAVPNPPAAYQPGGSVHDSQVPDFEDRHGSDGSLHEAWVPQPGPRILVP